jgi:type II secretory pathway pseudopilin PulG
MQRFSTHPRRRKQQGYILLMMMLFIALLAIASLAALPKMEMQAKRDREEEMIHRGAQYARAIRAYVKKFGRYPTSIADLENTNNTRFLRRRYKDPITGKDFRLLHMGDIQGLMGGMMAAPGGGMFSGNAGAAAGAGQAGLQQGGVPVGNAAPTTPSNSAQSDNSQPGNTNGDNSGANDANSGGNSSNGNSSGNGSSSSSSGPSGQVFGGGPIMGVASSSKDKTIRVFNNKEHYNEWVFIYDPTTDLALITGPYQPMSIGQTQGVGQPITPNGIGNQGGFGNPNNTGFGSQPMQPQNPGMMNQTTQH